MSVRHRNHFQPQWHCTSIVRGAAENGALPKPKQVFMRAPRLYARAQPGPLVAAVLLLLLSLPPPEVQSTRYTMVKAVVFFPPSHYAKPPRNKRLSREKSTPLDLLDHQRIGPGISHISLFECPLNPANKSSATVIVSRRRVSLITGRILIPQREVRQ